MASPTRGRDETREFEMPDKDRIAGSGKQIKGAVKEAVGKAFGDTKLVAEGAADKTEGKVQNAMGGVKDTIKEALKSK